MKPPFSAWRTSLIFVFFCIYFISDYVCDQSIQHSPSFSLPVPSTTTLKCKIATNYIICQISILVFGTITLFWLLFIYLCKNVRFVKFNANLNLCAHSRNLKSPNCVWTLLSLIMLGLLVSEYPEDLMFFLLHASIFLVYLV